MSENANVEALLSGVRTLDADGATDDDVAAWLKDRTVDFGQSVSVLALARGAARTDVADRLRATATWQRAITRFLIVEPDGTVGGEFHSINGRTYSVGDVLKLPGGACRVTAVDPADDPRFTAHLGVDAGE